MQWALVAALVSVAPVAADPVSPRLSTEAATVAVPTIVAPAPAARPPRPSYVGLTFDLGMPDIIGVGVVVRPLWWLRLVAGGSSDLFSGGLGGGVVFVPLRRRLSPAISVDGGHVFPSATRGVPRAFGVNVDGQIVGYDFVSLQAGLEFAINRRVSLSACTGVSFIDVSAVPDGSKPTNIKSADLHVWSPAGKVAVMVYL